MSVLFIDGFDNYTLLEDKWDEVYTGASIVQGAGKRNTAGLQIGSSYSSYENRLGLNLEDTNSLIVGFAYKKDISKHASTNDVALDKPTFGESVYVLNYADYAVDGDRSSKWEAATNSVASWIKVDLLDVKNICGFGLELIYGLEYSWEYYGSNNNTDWYLIASEPMQVCQNLVTTTSGIDVNYRYIMADITPNGSYRASAVSFQAYEFVDGTREDVCTTSLSFFKDDIEQCRLSLGVNNITFWYGFSNEDFLEGRDTWGENFNSDYTGVTEDCMLFFEAPDQNYNNTSISVGCGSATTRINRTQLKFDLSYLKSLKDTIYPSLEITYAFLYLYATGGAGGPHNVSVYRCLQNWDETEATWNSFSSGNSWNSPGASAVIEYNNNIATSGTASSDSVYSGSFPASNANDGSTSTRWLSDGGGTDSWWIVTWSQEYYVDHIGFIANLAGANEHFNEYYLDYWDGASWQEVIHVTGYTEQSPTVTYHNVYQYTQKLRMRLIGGSDYHGMYEFYAYGAETITTSGIVDGGIYDRVGIAEDTFPVQVGHIGRMVWDITDLSNMWLDGTANQYGVHIKSDNENVNNYIYIASSTGTDGSRPYLDLYYTTTASGVEANNCMVSGTWNYIETKINFNDISGNIDVKVNENFVLTASGIGTTVSGNDEGIDLLTLRSIDGVLAQPDEYVYSSIDDLYICNTSGTNNNNDFLGVCLVDVAYPSASGTNNDYDINYYYDDKRYEVVDGVTYERGAIYEATIPVSNSFDDGYFNTGQSFTTNTNYIRWEGWAGIYGYDGMSFFRFHDINIPRNATILETTLKFVSYESAYANNLYMDGRFESSGVPTTPPISQIDLESRELTSIESRASWSGDHSITLNTSTNLNNSLQELVDRYDWVAENNIITAIVSFGGYYGNDAYLAIRNYDWVWSQTNPQNYLEYLPQLYIKWQVDVIYDMSEYVQSTVNGHKDTYYHDTTTTSGVTVSGLSDIYAIQHNLKSKYIVKQDAENVLDCKSVVIVSGTEHYSSLIDYTVVTGTESAEDVFYKNKIVLFEENPETSFSWTGNDIVNLEAGSVII